MQFSHFSVKEFLTSARLSTASQDVSRYYIALGPAHTILAQACVSVLLQLHDRDEQDNAEKGVPLAMYAAEHWVRHAQYEDVALQIKGMEYLFDPDKPYFEAWLQLHDKDELPSFSSAFGQFISYSNPRRVIAKPLYYAALCGFRNLVEQLIVKYPQHVNAIGGYYMTPAVAALAGSHFELVDVLRRNGSSVDPRGFMGNSPLHSAAFCEDLDMVQAMLHCGVNVNARNEYNYTPLAFTTIGRFKDPKVVLLLLDHGADPNAWCDDTTTLHNASQKGNVEMVRLLVERGASVEVKNGNGMTPMGVASGEHRDEIVKLLLKHSAK